LPDMDPQNVMRISSTIPPTPKSNRTLGDRSSQPLGCGIAASAKGALTDFHGAR